MEEEEAEHPSIFRQSADGIVFSDAESIQVFLEKIMEAVDIKIAKALEEKNK